MDNELTEKQKRFVEEYLVDLNATQAAIRAGYSQDTACEQGSRLLANAKVQAVVAERRKAIANKIEVTQERVAQELAKLAFLDIRKAFDAEGNLKPIADLDDETAAALAGIEIEVTKLKDQPIVKTHKIKLSDKKGALDSLARHLGMFKDKVEHSGTISLPELVARSISREKEAK